MEFFEVSRCWAIIQYIMKTFKGCFKIYALLGISFLGTAPWT